MGTMPIGAALRLIMYGCYVMPVKTGIQNACILRRSSNFFSRTISFPSIIGSFTLSSYTTEKLSAQRAVVQQIFDADAR
jgi:hypothetical protein